VIEWLRDVAKRAWSAVSWTATKIFIFMIRYPVATILTIFTVVVAVILAFFGRTIQIGGLLGKLWGKKGPVKSSRNEIAPGRVDESGSPIQPGKSDAGGWVQAPVSTDIKDPGIFDDPNVVTVVHPEKGDVKIPLPTGVKNSDVKEVVEIRPDVYEVRRNDNGVDTKEVLAILGMKP
jgi:hypothetical protein